MTRSILDAIKLGVWDFEPCDVPANQFPPTRALPGTNEKIEVLAERLSQGLPLWHPSDRQTVLELLAVDNAGSVLEDYAWND